MKIAHPLIVTILLTALAACSRQDRTSSQINIGMAEEVVSLDTNDSTESEPIIAAVSLVTTDEAGNIYLVDPIDWKIHSYTSDLVHRWSAGGEGSGPGLFNTISALLVDDEQLYVYEQANTTMTLYSLAGERLREWTLGDDNQPLNRIRRMANGLFAATGFDEKSETVVNLYSDDFKSRISQFIEVKEIFKSEKPELETQVLRSYPGSVMPVNNSTVVYTPAAYSGQLLMYKLNSDGSWIKSDTMKGYMNIESPLMFRQSSDGNDERSHLSGFNPEGGYFHAEFTSISHGLYELKNGQIAHLSSSINKNDQWDLIIEYFKPDNFELQDYITIEGFIQSQQFRQMPLWMDQNAQIYIYENSDTPLRVIKVADNPNE